MSESQRKTKVHRAEASVLIKVTTPSGDGDQEKFPMSPWLSILNIIIFYLNKYMGIMKIKVIFTFGILCKNV